MSGLMCWNENSNLIYDGEKKLLRFDYASSQNVLFQGQAVNADGWGYHEVGTIYNSSFNPNNTLVVAWANGRNLASSVFNGGVTLNCQRNSYAAVFSVNYEVYRF